MDGKDMYNDLRVLSFSCYIDSAEESFVPKLTEGVPVSSSIVNSPEEYPYLKNLERSNKNVAEVSTFGSHKDFSNKKGVCMRCCTIFACEGTCLERRANGTADRGVHGMIQSQPGLENVEHFSFPVLNSRIDNLEVNKHVIAEEALQGDASNSVEMFGSGMTKNEDIVVNLARKFSRLTWDAIPNTGSRDLLPASSGNSSWYDDTGSDNSSDLFEIESVSSTRYSMLSRQEPYALSKDQNSVKASAADKSLTICNYEERNLNCVGDMSSTYKTTKPKDSCRLKGRSLWLLGCKSNNAVNVAENTSRVSQNAKGGKKYPFSRKGPSPLQPKGI